VASIADFVTDERYDLVVNNMVLHFVASRVGEAVLKRMKETWTEPGGLNLVAVFTTQNPRNARPQLYEPDFLRSMYQDWKTVSHYLGPSTLVTTGPDAGRRFHVERMVAQKPMQRSEGS
jgi:hypothetical protein